MNITGEEFQIIQHWQAGYSAKYIAEKVGVTRNSVLGKVHRLRRDKGVTLCEHTYETDAPKISDKSHFAQRANRIKAAMEMKRERAALASNEKHGVPFLDRKSNQCAFIPGDYGEYAERFCCGKPTDFGSSYCPGHHALCYTPSKNFSDDALDGRTYNMRKILRTTKSMLNVDFERANGI